MSRNQDTVASYTIHDQTIDVVLCYEGDGSSDGDMFYDIYNRDTGACLNLGEPWHDDGEGVPTAKEVSILVAPNPDLLSTGGAA